MPLKPVRFGIKVWVVANALSKYLWNFEVYCGKHGNPYDGGMVFDSNNREYTAFQEEEVHAGKSKGLQDQNVIKGLMQDLARRGHIVTIDNFFTLVPLFLDLLDSGIMAIGTLWANMKYVPHAMFAKAVTKKKSVGWIGYRMYRERKVCCMVWKGKQAVVLLSTHVEPISPSGKHLFVWRKFGGKKKIVITSPMHLQYTQNMRGVDTANQLHGVYSCLTRSHKWWHRVFFFLLDSTVSNM